MSKSMDTKKTTKIPAVKIPPQALRNEGEGSYEGARAYDSDVRDFVKSGSVEAAAKKRTAPSTKSSPRPGFCVAW